MRCLTCGYDLRRLPSPRCPECGRTFDPNDRTTFLHHAEAGQGVQFDAWMAVVLAAFAPGVFLYGLLRGGGSVWNVNVVAVLPHSLMGAVLAAFTASRAMRTLAAKTLSDARRRKIRRAVWIALFALLVSGSFLLLAVAQIARPLI